MSDTKECLFCRIAAGTVPSHPVYESGTLYAFLDINPIRPGHTQIVPRKHYPYFDLMPSELAAEIVALGQILARTLEQIYAVERVGFLFTGSDIPHAHAHVVPMVSPTDITSRQYIAEESVTFRPTARASDDELVSVARVLCSALE
ncbi:histidine triad (HIT) family protein [Rhodoligotrophos appendicifer]|uniref:HIT family protein n=1 Tax=Rhodoligotrophos appendicifer TaxID=987056 RepID=UPI001186DDE5|nr:HIT family protein [Rhodoligotrophos appendicifer]